MHGLIFIETVRGPLRDDLQHFSDWTWNNGLNLNAKKCQAFEVKFRNTTPHQADLSIGSDKLKYVGKAKILGLWIQSDLKWQTQVDVMIKKANNQLFMLRSLERFGFDQDELSTGYMSYVRPVVEYADVVWHSGQSGDIERIQRRACRTILGHRFTTYSESIKRYNLIKLSDMRVDHCLSFAKGLEDNPWTRHLIPPTRIAVHGYNLQNANDLTQPMTKTKIYKQSLVLYFITLLNKH